MSACEIKMNLLQRALIEKSGHDNGFENVLPVAGEGFTGLGSARHPAEVKIQPVGGAYLVTLTRCQPSLPSELARSFPDAIATQGGTSVGFRLATEAALGRWLRRAASLARALPDQVVTSFEVQVQAALAELLGPTATKSTEVQRLVRQRVGQQAFRFAMLDYWGGACAVTGVAIPQALRASHAMPWALCITDAQRLDVYNGFLLSANLDALFDAFLATFEFDGSLVVSPAVSVPVQLQLGIASNLRLRWLDERHLPYLVFHRSQCQWL